MSTLLGEWSFLDTLNDSGGSGLHATVNFSPVYVDGPFENTRGIQFTAPTDRIVYGRTGLEPTTGGIISMLWVKIDGSNSGFMSLVNKVRAADSTRHSIDLDGNSLFAMSRWRDQMSFATLGSALNDAQWHHLCNVDAEDRYARYIDGVLIDEAARSGSSPVVWNDYPWHSGYNPDSAGYEANSAVSISHVRLLQGTMDTAEVEAWMNSPLAYGEEPTGLEMHFVTAGGLVPVAPHGVVTAGGVVPVTTI